ncbi:MAG: hypothetical protein JW814_10250 [Candidatus Krumholzibacteriota bacterium]|nr:hypothetical protein [Candidatus Krumholzibacteriota bacterium]
MQTANTNDCKLLIDKIREITSSIEEDLAKMDLKLLSEVLDERRKLLIDLGGSGIDERILYKILTEIRERDAVIRARLSLQKARVSKEIGAIRMKEDATERYSIIARQSC